MGIKKQTAYEFIANAKIAVKFKDEGLTSALKKGRLVNGELCFLRAPISHAVQIVATMVHSINTDNFLVLVYSCSEAQATAGLSAMHVDSMHALILALKCMTSMKNPLPRVLFLIDTDNLLAGFTVSELLALLRTLMEQKVVVITNCLNLSKLATQVIDY
jgi:hypothetical protein